MGLSNSQSGVALVMAVSVLAQDLITVVVT